MALQGCRSDIWLLGNKSLFWSLPWPQEVWAWCFSTSCIYGTDISNKTSPNFYCCPLMQELQFCVQVSWLIMITHFKPLISTYYGWFWWIWLRPHAKSAFSTLLLLHRLVLAQSSSFLLLWDWFILCFMDGSILQQFSVFYASHIVHIILKLN